MVMAGLPLGKLSSTHLARLLDEHGSRDPRLIIGPKLGEDAAVLAMDDRCLIAKTDPITFATDEIGWYAVHINANDVATCGAQPRWFQACVLLPEGGTTADLVDRIFEQMASACEAIGASLIGGHTEVTEGLDRPIVVGSMLGEVEHQQLVTTSGAQVGDAIVLTKGIVVEGAAVLAREMRTELRERGIAEETLYRAGDFLYHPGISVVPEARIAAEVGVHAMHDPTEGGLALGLYELASASQVGVRIHSDQIPYVPESRRICEALGIDPLKTLTSGTLLVALASDRVPAFIRACQDHGIVVAEIGEIRPQTEGLLIEQDGEPRKLEWSEQDELARFLDA